MRDEERPLGPSAVLGSSEPAGAALIAAVALLAHKRFTKAALQRKLRDRGYAPDAADAAVQECERRGFIDDRTYAELHVKNVLDRKPVGRMRLLQELLRHGVDGNLAREVLDGHDADEDDRIDRALAKLVLSRPHDGYGQLGRRLERLGFGAPAIARALRRRAESAFPSPDDFEEQS
jgi:regulatory protein